MSTSNIETRLKTWSYVAYAAGNQVRGYCEIICDSEDAIGELPADDTIAPGSIVTITATGNKYVLNNNHEWVQQSGGSGEQYDGSVVGGSSPANPDDPVVIIYNDELIGSLAGGDDDEAVIKTGGTIVEHDINVRYAAPTPNMVAVNGSGDADDFLIATFSSAFLKAINGKIVSVGSEIGYEGFPDYIAPAISEDSFYINILIPRLEDNLNVTINNQAVAFNVSAAGYEAELTFNDYPESISIEINDKQ